jgi:flagellar biosynthetic protein FlhB
MADTSQKTEKPTARRLQKARREGQFAVSRDFVGGLQFTAFVILASAYGASWFAVLRHSAQAVIRDAFSGDLANTALLQLVAGILKDSLLPLAIAGSGLVLTGVGFQLATTRMGASLKKLMPSMTRFQPLTKIKSIPSQGLPAVLQAVIMLAVSAAVLYWLALTNANALFMLPLSSLEVGLAKMRSVCFELLWKGAALLLTFGLIDLFRQKRRFMKQMRMSKQEVRDELKETEGNPQTKARVRRLQREARRRKMMSEVATATAVIVNPTHYAVAIRYKHDAMATPVVVAKGKNHLALRIRQKAIECQVPLIENPPLAQGLYKAVKVGQEIPPKFYRAIAEILAYVYRLMSMSVA